MQLINIKPSTQLIFYFLLAFAIAWGTWLPSFMHPQSFRLFPFIGLFAPAISAVVLTIFMNQSVGVKNLLSRCLQFRFGIGWYAISILLLPFLFIISFRLDSLIFHTSFKNIILPTSPYFVAAAFIWLMFINSGEEIGWRGFALPRLQKLLKNPIQATLVLGILWSIWHLPIYLTPGQSSFPVLLFIFFIIGISFIYTVVFNKTKGSLSSVILLHASTDIMPRMLNITLFKPTTWFILGILTWISGMILIFTAKYCFGQSLLNEGSFQVTAS